MIPASKRHPSLGLVAAVVAALLAGACSADIGMLGDSGTGESSKLFPSGQESTRSADAGKQSQSELAKAIEYWGNEHKARPTDLKAGLAYARNLKAAGHKDQAFGVLQSLALLHGDSKELASEYGRLALDLGQVQVAQQLLTAADDPTKPDWRVVSALGTVQAKQGHYTEAVPFYERALSLSPDQPSVLNNLAMAYAANGEPAKAEEILRRAASRGSDDKIQKNLALVMDLQGKSGAAAKPDVAAEAQPAPMPAAQPVATPPAPKATAAAARTASAARKQAAQAAASAPVGGDDAWSAMRASAGPNAVAAPNGGWATSVARAN